MEQPRYTKEEVAARARAIYDQQIRAQVEPQHLGKFLVIDIESGDYEIDEDDVAAMKRAAQKHPADALYGMRIGYRTMGRIGVATDLHPGRWERRAVRRIPRHNLLGWARPGCCRSGG